jgi:two-component system LytT family response regulator
MKTLKAVIIDDEAGGRNNLKILIENYFPQLEVVGLGEDVFSGLKCIQECQPDLVFLDIEMPQHNGFKLLELLPEADRPEIIFTTAYDKYAIQAIRAEAADYLLKPINTKDLEQTLNRVISRSRSTVSPRDPELQLSAPNRLGIAHQEGYTFVQLDHIIYLAADRSYTRVFLEEASPLMVARPLVDFEECLKDSGFFRPHRSYLVNLSKVEELLRREGGYLVLSDQTQIPISRNKREEFLQLFRLL